MSNIFEGFEFFISNIDEIGTSNSKKSSLESMIVEHGGTKVQNFLPNSTTHIIASVIDYRTNNIIKKFDTNVYSPKWVIDCIKYQRLIPLSPLYMKFINKETTSIFKNTIDIYNDNFFEDIGEDTLVEILSSMPKLDEEKNYKEVLYDLKEEYGGDCLLIDLITNRIN